MSTIRAYLGTAGLLDVGYRFHTQSTAAGARVDTGIVDEGEGWYSAAGVALAGDHVRWDSTGTADAIAREDLALRIAAEGIKAKTDNLPADPASNTQVNTRSSHSAADVWAVNTRTLSSFGTLVADIWAAVANSAGVTTLLSRITSALTITGGKVDVNDKTGFALTAGERTAIAVEVEGHLLDEGDSQMLINAITAAIGNTNLDQAAVVAAIRADLERTGGTLKLIIAKTDTIPVNPAAVSDIPTAAETAGATTAAVTADHGPGSYERNTEPDNAAASAGAAAAVAVNAKLTTGRAAKLDRDLAEKSDFPDDYQQREVAVALPNPAPEGYGGSEGDTAGVTTLLGRLSAPRAAFLDKLDVGEPEEPIIAVLAPANADQITGYIITYDANGELQPEASIRYQMTAPPSTATGSFSNKTKSGQSAAVTALFQAAFVKGATYEAWRGKDGTHLNFVVPEDEDGNGGFQLPQMLGSP